MYLLFFPKGCIYAVCLTTKRYPGSHAEENQYLNYAVVGQHVWVYKIKWGLKLISNSPWKKSTGILKWNWELKLSVGGRQWPPPGHLHNCFCFSKLNKPFYYCYLFYFLYIIRKCRVEMSEIASFRELQYYKVMAVIRCTSPLAAPFKAVTQTTVGWTSK